MTSAYLAVVGYRDYTNKQRVFEAIDAFIRIYELENITIVSGGASGVDALARLYAEEHDYPYQEYPYEKSLGLRGGPARNTKIVNQATHLLAFPSHRGKGTQDSIRKAQLRGIPHEVVWVD
jgi:hypothetical protein